MLDYLRNLTKSDEEKRQEMLTAYLDGALTPKQQQQVERELAQDEAMKAQIDQMRFLQREMRQLPQRRVRRNFTLDPALFGRPQREPLVQAYPVLRTATVMAAFLFIFVLAFTVFEGGSMGGAEPMTMSAIQQEDFAAEMAAGEPASESNLFEADIIEKSEQAFEAVPVAPEFEMPAEEEEAAFEEGAFEAAEAVPLDSASSMEKPEAEMPAEEMLETDGEAARAEPSPIPKVEATADMILEAIPPVPVETERDVAPETGLPETHVQDRSGFNMVSALQMIILFLGVAFAVLIILTLMARRRL